MRLQLALLAVILPTLALSSTQDPSQLCRDAGTYDMKQVLDPYLSTVSNVSWNLPTDQFVQNFLADFTSSGESQLGPWELLFSSRSQDRFAAHLMQLDLADRLLRAHGRTDGIENVLKLYSASPIPYSQAALTEHRKMLAYIRNQNNILSPDLAKLQKFTPEICLVYPFPGCQAAIDRVLGLMAPTDIPAPYPTDWGAVVSLPTVIDTMFSRPEYRQGISLLGLRLIEKVQAVQSGHLAPAKVGDLFDDAMTAFHDIGMDDDSATEMTMNLLGFYGTRGASMPIIDELTNSESYPLMSALYAITTAMGVLDSAVESTGHYYSLPPAYQGQCSFGRPYHFWMAAYLAWELRREGFNKLASMMAPHVVGVLYEVGFDHSTADDPIYNGPFLNLDTVNSQINVTFDDAGARFGLRFADRSQDPDQSLDIPYALSLHLNNARPMPNKKDLSSSAKVYFWYRWAAAPEADMSYWIWN